MTNLIAIPAHNEFDNLKILLPRLFSFIKKHEFSFEVVIFNDGSTDGTRDLDKNFNVKIYNMAKTKGIGEVFNNIKNYFISNSFENLITIDADNQFNVDDIAQFLNINKNSDDYLILGSRFQSGSQRINMPLHKFIGNVIYSKIISGFLRFNITDVSCGFRMYSKKAVYKMELDGYFTYTHESIIDLVVKGTTLLEVPIKVIYFSNRESRVASSLILYVYRTFIIILKIFWFKKPTTLLLIVSILFATTSIITGYLPMKNWIQNESITPYKGLSILSALGFVISILSFSNSLQLYHITRLRRKIDKLFINYRN